MLSRAAAQREEGLESSGTNAIAVPMLRNKTREELRLRKFATCDFGAQRDGMPASRIMPNVEAVVGDVRRTTFDWRRLVFLLLLRHHDPAGEVRKH